MYNLPSVTQTDVIPKYNWPEQKCFFSLRGIVICVAILTLTVSLANRTGHAVFCNKPTAHTASSSAKIQHRDKDASEWVAPVATFVLLHATETFITQPSSERVLVDRHYDSLHNRPPPIGPSRQSQLNISEA